MSKGEQQKSPRETSYKGKLNKIVWGYEKRGV